MRTWHSLCNNIHVDAHSISYVCRRLHKPRNDAEPFNGAYRPPRDVANASSNTMDITLSEAPLCCHRPL
ncbi:hypothetical protein EGT71_21600 [Atlantibacter subterranea]|uniref:Uncharacterized protein n=1 Tax=Atlantibacter subterraneus TaxID=255519 RepID=A0A3R9LHN9_9ENTR|nr:hypothetical protein EGK67_20900 [Atlantibacter subterranea]RSE01222.1 hypothetical protein EGT84_21525 [Atlantibacter subterranea]RSE22240.1 hypothetical protein EGT71_21600 [Atlantibacter subterranea]